MTFLPPEMDWSWWKGRLGNFDLHWGELGFWEELGFLAPALLTSDLWRGGSPLWGWLCNPSYLDLRFKGIGFLQSRFFVCVFVFIFGWYPPGRLILERQTSNNWALWLHCGEANLSTLCKTLGTRRKCLVPLLGTGEATCSPEILLINPTEPRAAETAHIEKAVGCIQCVPVLWHYRGS